MNAASLVLPFDIYALTTLSEEPRDMKYIIMVSQTACDCFVRQNLAFTGRRAA